MNWLTLSLTITAALAIVLYLPVVIGGLLHRRASALLVPVRVPARRDSAR